MLIGPDVFIRPEPENWTIIIYKIVQKEIMESLVTPLQPIPKPSTVSLCKGS